jgi:hypothetical protein
MASLATLPLPAEQPEIFGDPQLVHHTGHDAWLLPSQELEPAERVIRLCSMLVGPIVFVAESALLIDWLF